MGVRETNDDFILDNIEKMREFVWLRQPNFFFLRKWPRLATIPRGDFLLSCVEEERPVGVPNVTGDGGGGDGNPALMCAMHSCRAITFANVIDDTPILP